ncbi:hypothetical protein ETB97_004872 [Aspergillus alliaceus]|uniref:DUF7703 domain-containing protein n=1 Tax=Petromyces alliaceus TaxID=209559 RepID=A0A8H6E3G4_PETAA|nr:hypothetical protein ETB97_004872 [Aspergillus burnettii]
MTSHTLSSLMLNGTNSSSSPSNWVTGSYTGNSDGLRITITTFVVVAWYNAIELIILIFSTFKKYRGVYFSSMLISAIGILPYSVGFFMKFFDLTSAVWLSLTLVTVGWWTMVTGQSFVLYSRLHLVVQNPTALKFVCYMIIANVFLLHIPTTVLTYAANYEQSQEYLTAYNVMERVQVAGFCAQELIISGIYMWETNRLLKLNPNRDNRNIIFQLFIMNLVCILMDIVLIAVECANLYIYQTTLKATVYSVKLKVEFGVLGKLIYIANQSAGRQPEEAYLELSRLPNLNTPNATRTTTQSKPRRASIEDISFRLRSIVTSPHCRFGLPTSVPGLVLNVSRLDWAHYPNYPRVALSRYASGFRAIAAFPGTPASGPGTKLSPDSAVS